MLEKIKTALQLTDNTFNTEINVMIEQAKKDMAFAGIEEKTIDASDPDYAYEQAIILFCLFRFELIHGNATKCETLERIYKEQKRMLGMATGYTDWGE